MYFYCYTFSAFFAEDYTPYNADTTSAEAIAGTTFCSPISVIDDQIFEQDNETFRITLTVSSAAFRANPGEAIAVIHDNDGLHLL